MHNKVRQVRQTGGQVPESGNRVPLALFALSSPCSACHQFLFRLQRSGGLVCERCRRFDQLDSATARLERKIDEASGRRSALALTEASLTDAKQKVKRLKARRLPASATHERILAGCLDKELADEALRRYTALHERAKRKAP
ncbi:hypothetical protein [Streptomyces sp. NPDC059378]|uniref:hypothetical protein n=1 Tax=Streptomyces sp. NPDC059378 TaxID=3346815 RepID=UPI00369F2358